MLYQHCLNISKKKKKMDFQKEANFIGHRPFF